MASPDQLVTAITGESSCFKTRTGYDVANLLPDGSAIVISRGSFFRTAAVWLAEHQITPHDVTHAHVADILTILECDVSDNILSVGMKGNKTMHTSANGIAATAYASAVPFFKQMVSQHIDRLPQTQFPDKSFVFPDKSFVIFEGRQPAPEDGLTVWMSAPVEVRAQIRRIECLELKDEPIESVIQGMQSRDEKDVAAGILAKPLNGHMVVKRKSTSGVEQAAIADAITERMVMTHEGFLLPLHNEEIIYEYKGPIKPFLASRAIYSYH
jgi:cytidylate kinase